MPQLHVKNSNGSNLAVDIYMVSRMHCFGDGDNKTSLEPISRGEFVDRLKAS